MPPTTRAKLLHSALHVSIASAGWTLTASSAAIVIGLSRASLALVAFGVVGILDCAASVALVAHFLDVRSGGTAERLERLALRMVVVGLATVGIVTAVVSGVHLLEHVTAGSSSASVILAGASLVALSALSLRKHHVAVRLPSHALMADSRLSAVGAILAAVTLGGTASNSLGWWWADPAAAFVIAIGALGLGVALRREPAPSTPPRV
jgi:divalent metal cation (Fe/Co/Zn/Cd) transporter